MPPRARASFQRVLSPTEAERAIYFDFEGNKNAPPSLLGWLSNSEYSQAVISESYFCLQDKMRDLDYVGFTPTLECLADLVQEARESDSLLVSFSIHELQQIERISIKQNAMKLYNEFQSVYVNGKYMIGRYLNGFLGENEVGKKDRSLKSYMNLVGLTHSDGDNGYQVGPALIKLHRACRKEHFDDADYVVIQTELERILEHNLSDLTNTQRLVQLAANGLINNQS